MIIPKYIVTSYFTNKHYPIYSKVLRAVKSDDNSTFDKNHSISSFSLIIEDFSIILFKKHWDPILYWMFQRQCFKNALDNRIRTKSRPLYAKGYIGNALEKKNKELIKNNRNYKSITKKEYTNYRSQCIYDLYFSVLYQLTRNIKNFDIYICKEILIFV